MNKDLKKTLKNIFFPLLIAGAGIYIFYLFFFTLFFDPVKTQNTFLSRMDLGNNQYFIFEKYTSALKSEFLHLSLIKNSDTFQVLKEKYDLNHELIKQSDSVYILVRDYKTHKDSSELNLNNYKNY